MPTTKEQAGSEVREEEDEVESRQEQKDNENQNLERRKRTIKLPKHFKDFEMAHFALNAEAFVEDLPLSLEKAKSKPDYKYWKMAVKEEIECLIKNDAWVLVPKPANVKVLENKWVFRIKRDQHNNVRKYKARLVAKGFMEKQGFDYKETYAPVAKVTTIRILLAIIN